MIDRMDRGLCTYRQAKTLRKFGKNPTDMSFAEASSTLDQLIGGKRK
jgi:hypothetical protein